MCPADCLLHCGKIGVGIAEYPLHQGDCQPWTGGDQRMGTHGDKASYASFPHCGDDVPSHTGDGGAWSEPWRTEDRDDSVLPTYRIHYSGGITAISFQNGLESLHICQCVWMSGERRY